MENIHLWATKFPHRAITTDLTQPGPQPSNRTGDQTGGGRRGRVRWGGTEAWLNLNFLWLLLLLWVRSPLIPVPNQRVKRAPGLIHHVAFANRTTWEVTDDFKTYVLGSPTPSRFWPDDRQSIMTPSQLQLSLAFYWIRWWHNSTVQIFPSFLLLLSLF